MQSMTEDVETVPMRGTRVTWDGTNDVEMHNVAGRAVIGFGADTVVVRSCGDGQPWIMHPGWQFTKWEDGTWTISTPGHSTVRAVAR